MIQLLNPAALWAALAVAAPIFIHLWSKRVGRRLHLGTLRWLTPTLSAQARALRLHDLWLLLLRCTILLLLALWWAGPVWQGSVGAGATQAGRVLISPTLLQREQPRAFYHQIDSLLAAGHTLHALAPGFPAITLETKWASAASDSLLNYWQLAHVADAEQPAGTLLALHTDDAAVHYTGMRPSTSARVRWHVWPQTMAAGTLSEIIDAYYTPDSVVVWVQTTLQDQPQRSAIVASWADAKAGRQLPNGFAINAHQQGSVWFVALHSKDAAPTQPHLARQAAPLRVASYAPATRQPELSYLRAAYTAIAAAQHLPIHFVAASGPADTLTASVYLWAYDTAPTVQNLPAGSTCVWLHGAAKWQVQPRSSLHSAVLPPAADASTFVRPVTVADSATTVLQDDAGRAVLATQQLGRRRLVHLLLPLTPQATNWMLQPSFVYAWWQLMRQPIAPQPTRLPAQQIIPQQTLAATAPQTSQAVLNDWVFLLVMLLFTTERWLASRQNT